MLGSVSTLDPTPPQSESGDRGRNSAPTSRPSSQPTSRSSSRARDFLNKVTHLGAPQDWATQSFGNAPIAHPSVRSPTASRDPSPDRSRSASKPSSRDASPAGSRSNSRARVFFDKVANSYEKVTHMGPGSDWAAHSLGTPDLHAVANGEERSGRSSRGASPAGSRSASRSASRVRTVLDQVTHMGAGGSDWAAHSMAGMGAGTPVHAAPAVVKEEAVVV